MTTIAANRVCMASDSKVTHGDTSFKGTKIYKVGNTIIGGCGTSSQIVMWLNWYKQKGKKTKPEYPRKTDFDMLVLTPKGLFHSDENCEFEEIDEPFYAIGNGQTAALVAMDLGCDPAAAIEAVCKRDNQTGGPIQVFSLD